PHPVLILASVVRIALTPAPLVEYPHENRSLLGRTWFHEPTWRAAGSREDALSPTASAGTRRGQAYRQAAWRHAIPPGLRQRPGADAVRREAVQPAIDQPRRDRHRSIGAQARAARDLREASSHPGPPQWTDADRRDGRPVEHLRDRRAQVPHAVQ